MNDEEHYQLGLKTREKALGKTWSDQSVANRSAFNQDFQDFNIRYMWSEIWTRKHFDDRTRRLIVLATLLARGSWEEFEAHVKAGVKEGGLSTTDIKEVILQQTAYCGVPTGVRGMNTAEAALIEIGALPPKKR